MGDRSDICRPICALVCTSLCLSSLDVRAEPAPTASASDGAPAASESQASTETANTDEQPTAKEPGQDKQDEQPTIVAAEGPEQPSNMSGNAVVDADDPDATRASSELEGTAIQGPLPANVPEKLPKLQAAGWWTLFGAFVLGSTGGVFAGMAEVQEDRASRLASMVDDQGNLLKYADYSETYEGHLSRGQTYSWVARGFVIAGGAAVITAIALFAADHRRKRKGLRARRRGPRLTATGLEVAF